MSNPTEMTVKLGCAHGTQAVLTASLAFTSRGISISFDGYGDAVSMDNEGMPMWIENREGVPYVVVWGDIRREEPTAVFGLEGAAESRRECSAGGD